MCPHSLAKHQCFLWKVYASIHTHYLHSCLSTCVCTCMSSCICLITLITSLSLNYTESYGCIAPSIIRMPILCPDHSCECKIQFDFIPISTWKTYMCPYSFRMHRCFLWEIYASIDTTFYTFTCPRVCAHACHHVYASLCWQHFVIKILLVWLKCMMGQQDDILWILLVTIMGVYACLGLNKIQNTKVFRHTKY